MMDGIWVSPTCICDLAAALLTDAQHLYKLVYSRDGVAAAYFRLLVRFHVFEVAVID